MDKAGVLSSTLQVNFAGSLSSKRTFDVIAGSAANWCFAFFTAATASLQPGSSFGIAVWVEDSFGNVVTSDNGYVNVVLTGIHGKTRLGETLSEPVRNGQVSFSSLTVKTVGKGYARGGTRAAGSPL